MRNQPAIAALGWGSSTGRRRALGYLLDEVVAARHHEQSQSRERVRPDDLHDARIGTLRALIDYADAIESLGWPVPRAVHMEIVLHRNLCGPLGPKPHPSPGTAPFRYS